MKYSRIKAAEITDRKAKHKFQKAQAKLNQVQKYFGVQKVRGKK